MEKIDDKWIMNGISPDDPKRIRTCHELTALVNELGFLPLFRNCIEGFSAEEYVTSDSWWTGDPDSDPWEWREIIARSGEVIYGKFFEGKAGFISKEYFPLFANHRRDGYDFDSLFEDGKAKQRSMKIMQLFENDAELFSHEIKAMAGFGKGGEKNFGGIMTELQQQTFLAACDFRCKLNKKGQEYGMRVTKYCTPEHLWGYDYVTSAYSEAPADSFERLVSRMREICPQADEKIIRKFLK